MGSLKTWARDNNPMLKFSDGESVVAKYIGYQVVPDTFNPGKEKIQYELEVDGKQKFWKSGSGATAEWFDTLSKGTMIKITAAGEGMKRRYELEVVEE